MAKSKILTVKEEQLLFEVKTQIDNNIRSANPNNILQVACENFKFAFEEAIKIAGDRGKTALVTSSKHINLFHEVVKSELIRNGVAQRLIFPPLNNSKEELNLAGFIKAKKQDISVVSKNHIGNEVPEIMNIGMMNGKTDHFGKAFTEHTLAINVRSQMSSITKNDDTIIERTFAETLNLHLRCPNMVLGELFILPITGFNSDMVKKRKPIFEPIQIVKKNKNSKLTSDAIEETINVFNDLNNRDISINEAYKYERVCLILADFSQTPVKIYTTANELKADNLLDQNSTASLTNIDFQNFISDLLKIYTSRFGTGMFS
jgi:hypothetical protein